MIKNQITDTLFELAGLGVIPRSGLTQYCFENFETIASHSHKVALLGYFLGIMLDADIGKVLTMAIFHDVTETRVGDSNYPQKKYITRNEDLATADQFADLPTKIKEPLLKSIKGYEDRRCLEAKIVKDADYLAFYLVMKQLEFKGNLEAKYRVELTRNKQIDFLFFEQSREILLEILEADPNQWTRALLSETLSKKSYN